MSLQKFMSNYVAKVQCYQRLFQLHKNHITRIPNSFTIKEHDQQTPVYFFYYNAAIKPKLPNTFTYITTILTLNQITLKNKVNQLLLTHTTMQQQQLTSIQKYTAIIKNFGVLIFITSIYNLIESYSLLFTNHVTDLKIIRILSQIFQQFISINQVFQKYFHTSKQKSMQKPWYQMYLVKSVLTEF
eukprot:TRINITY_DN8142_c0_g1_i6.p1 TRINITY_DN8142_c0_g1~~TRINITY_DN8142_c0_g1_i6.p1  ORF type:complete len:186 (+),score=-15.80 TRINITY_DN8142_c0_g1_i6:254-811(+)